MRETEYILRVILRARNEMAKVLAAATAELKAFGQNANKIDKDLEGLNKRITSMNNRLGNVTDKVAAWRATTRGMGRDSDEASRGMRGLDDDTQSTEKNAQRAAIAEK